MKFKNFVTTWLITATVASAATIMQTENFGYVPADSATLTFNQFDPALGTLTDITIVTDITKSGGSLFVDNESATAASGGISQSVTIDLTSADVSLVDVSLSPIGNNVTAVSTYIANVAADDGDGPGVQTTGADYDGSAFGDIGASDSGSVTPLVFSDYSGLGTFDINAVGAQGFDSSAIGGAAAAIDPASVSGTVTITYVYTPVPEPTSSLLAVLACGLGLLRRRR